MVKRSKGSEKLALFWWLFFMTISLPQFSWEHSHFWGWIVLFQWLLIAVTLRDNKTLKWCMEHKIYSKLFHFYLIFCKKLLKYCPTFLGKNLVPKFLFLSHFVLQKCYILGAWKGHWNVTIIQGRVVGNSRQLSYVWVCFGLTHAHTRTAALFCSRF